MTSTVAFTDSFINLLLFLLLSSSTILTCKASIDGLKPCFEQRIGQRLLDLLPYHSEWRMKTPEECLMFCALSSSRCRSIVYDNIQHVCYYFLDDGQQHVRKARGMVYFRVVEKKCLDQFLSGSRGSSEFTALETSLTTPKYNKSIDSIEFQRPAVAHANSLIHIPPDGRAITPTPYLDYFDNQQRLKKPEKFDQSDLTVATYPMSTSDKIFLPADDNTVITSLPKTLSDKNDQIYDKNIQMIPFAKFSTSTLPILSSIYLKNSNVTFRRLKALRNATDLSNNASFFIGNIRKLPVLGTVFGKDRRKNSVDLNKLLKRTTADVRRSPIQTSAMNEGNLSKNTSDTIKLPDREKSIVDRLMSVASVKSINDTIQAK